MRTGSVKRGAAAESLSGSMPERDSAQAGRLGGGRAFAAAGRRAGPKAGLGRRVLRACQTPALPPRHPACVPIGVALQLLSAHAAP